MIHLLVDYVYILNPEYVYSITLGMEPEACCLLCSGFIRDLAGNTLSRQPLLPSLQTFSSTDTISHCVVTTGAWA